MLGYYPTACFPFPFRGYPHMTEGDAGRPAVRPSPLSFYPPAAPSSYSTIVRAPIHLPRIPRSRTSTAHVATPFPFPPQLSLVVELSHATREWYSHILAQLAAPFPAAPGSIIASFARSATTGTPHIPLHTPPDTATHTPPASPPW
jgi:hypothetical protein